MTAEPAAPRTYGNWRQPQSPGLFGLGSVGTMIMIGGMIFVILIVMLTGSLLRAGFAALLLGGVLLAIVRKDRHGRNLLMNAGARGSWLLARRRGANVYRAGPLGRAAWGTYQLPGLAAPLRLSEHEDSYGRRFALLYCPRTTTYTVVVAAEPEGATLVDNDEIDYRVADWGAWLAALGDEPGVQAASVTIETAPDSGARLRREVHGRLDDAAPPFARAVLEETMDIYPTGASTVRAFIAITFSAVSRTDGRKRKDAEVGRDLAARLPGLTGRLETTGAGAARPLTAQRLCEVVRMAYDPDIASAVDDAYADGEDVDLLWSDVGPSAAQATWGAYRHDDAWSITWAMSDAPRGHVQDSVLNRMLQPHHEIARKRVTLLYRPIESARAAAIVESDSRASEFRVTASKKPTARDLASMRQAAATAAEEAAGAGLVNFGMLVTATVRDQAELPHVRATVDSLSATARLRLRPVYGAQDSAFAAALPLGLILPRHLKVPSEIQGKL